MKKNLKFVLPVVILLASVLAYKILTRDDAASTRRQNIPLVKTGTPVRQTMQYVLQFTGDMIPVLQANIFSKVSGNLERVYVDMGTQVRRNQLLALIDTTELYQQYQQASATYQNAKITYDRTKELVEQNLVSNQEIDNADAAMKISKANFETARTRLGYAGITAPFAGSITKRFLDPGALVSSNNSILFTLMDLNMMKVVINVLEKDIPLIMLGKKAVITVDAFPGKEFYGSVTRYSEAVDLSTRTMAVEIDIPNSGHTLKPGMFANVILVVDVHRNALTLPSDAILNDDTGTFVFVAASDTARRLNVKTGMEQGARTEVLSGLDGSEPVITTGQQFVKDGRPVSIQQ
jgi:RND family efflux transporter MFP subunit